MKRGEGGGERGEERGRERSERQEGRREGVTWSLLQDKLVVLKGNKGKSAIDECVIDVTAKYKTHISHIS